VLGAIAVAVLTIFRGIHPFLAMSEPCDGELLVVEGWVPEYAVREVAHNVKRRERVQVITVGGPLKSGLGVGSSDTYAHLAGERLVRFGVLPEMVRIVPISGRQRDRTHAFAVALHKCFDEERAGPRTLDVVTLGVHARRSRLLFSRVFGKSTDVRVHAIENRQYDPASWWRYSEGVKEVVSEGVAYLYAKLLFRPDE